MTVNTPRYTLDFCLVVLEMARGEVVHWVCMKLEHGKELEHVDLLAQRYLIVELLELLQLCQRHSILQLARDPRVLKRLLGRVALARMVLAQVAEEGARKLGKDRVALQIVSQLQQLLLEVDLALIHVLVGERVETAREHHMHDDTHGPDVDGFTINATRIYDLWRHIRYSTAIIIRLLLIET